MGWWESSRLFGIVAPRPWRENMPGKEAVLRTGLQGVLVRGT